MVISFPCQWCAARLARRRWRPSARGSVPYWGAGERQRGPHLKVTPRPLDLDSGQAADIVVTVRHYWSSSVTPALLSPDPAWLAAGHGRAEPASAGRRTRSPAPAHGGSRAVHK